MKILGIHDGHNSGATLHVDGEITLSLRYNKKFKR